jgi:excisionase family DNA binding protein
MPLDTKLTRTDATSSATYVVPRLFTIKQAAQYLSCAVWQVRTLCWAKEIPHIKLGKKFLIDKDDLDSFIDRRLRERA